MFALQRIEHFHKHLENACVFAVWLIGLREKDITINKRRAISDVSHLLRHCDILYFANPK